MHQILVTLLSGLIVSFPAASAPKNNQSPSTSPFFLQCRLSNTAINESKPVDHRVYDYTFEINLRNSQVRDINFLDFPFTISHASQGRVDAANESAVYARSLADGAELADLTVNRVTGTASLTFFKAPNSNEVRACEALAQTRGDTGWYCKSSSAVARHVGHCSSVKPQF